MKAMKEEQKNYLIAVLQLTLIGWYLYKLIKKDLALPTEKKGKRKS